MKWVFKLGGSHYAHARLAQLVRHAAEFAAPPIIVPGGGPFADQVRRAQKRWFIDDATTHKMAILAMRQYGMLLSALGNLPTAQGDSPAPPCVWLPTTDEDYGAADWTFTSDSIAARLAQTVQAENIVLLKAVRDAPLRDLVDERFMQLAQRGGLRVAVVDADAWLGARDVGDFVFRPCAD